MLDLCDVRRSNCLNVAALAWIRSRARIWLSGRRSHGKRGRILHFAVIAEAGPLAFCEMPDGTWHARPNGSTLYVLEYAPPPGQRKDSIIQAGAFPLLFDGLYYLRRYRQDADGFGKTFDASARMMVADAAKRLNKETAETFT